MALYVITGANRGLGLEFVRQLARLKQNTIVACTRSLKSDLTDLSSLNANQNIHILECDTSSDTSIHQLSTSIASKLPDTKVKYLINNAGILASADRDTLDIDSDELTRHFRVNVVGPAKVTETVLPLLAADSVVVNVSSGLGSCTYARDRGGICTYYSISKAALNMLTVQQAHDLAGRATVLAMCPGWVKTRMGGPRASLEPEESIRNMLEVVHRSTKEDSGRFLSHNGSEIPW